jgi:hypothetical protein
MSKELKFKFLNYFNSFCCYMKLMMQENSFCQNFSVFAVNTGFLLLLRNCTTLCNTDRLFMILLGHITLLAL